MQLTPSKNETPVYQINARAEDGLQPTSRWDTFYEQILVPVGSVFVVLLIILGIHLINH